MFVCFLYIKTNRDDGDGLKNICFLYTKTNDDDGGWPQKPMFLKGFKGLQKASKDFKKASKRIQRA